MLYLSNPQHEAQSWCWFGVGPPSVTLVQHLDGIGSVFHDHRGIMIVSHKHDKSVLSGHNIVIVSTSGVCWVYLQMEWF